MKLVNRVSAFFLAALALSLIGNAVFLWGLARHFLNQRFEQELMAALHTLVAAVEVEDGPELKLGVFTSLLGTPFFFWLVVRLQRTAP